jgi:cytochrome P450
MLTTHEIDDELARPDFLDDPYPTYVRIRQCGPVYRSAAWGAWLVTGFDQARETFRDWKRFSNEGRGLTLLAHLTDEERTHVEPFGRYLAMGGGLISSDPPVHTRIRGLVSRAFAIRVVESLRPKVQVIVDDLLDRVAEAGRMDIIRDLAVPLPATVIAAMLGVPHEDQAKFVEWSEAALAIDGSGKPTLPLVERAQFGYVSMANYFSDLVEERRTSRRGHDDLLTVLVDAHDSGQLSHGELLTTCTTILMGGFETTTSLIANTLHLLLTHPEQRAEAEREPAALSAAIEESLRFESPIQIVPRRVSERIDIGVHRLEPGDMLFVMVGAANRDPRQFADPDRFDIHRDSRHVTFGVGVHFCIGAPLARMEAPVALATILRRMPDIAFAEQRVHWNTAKPSARMPWQYHVEFSPGRTQGRQAR